MRDARVLAVLHAYCDESGTHGGAPCTVIAGFIGRAPIWDVVEADWRRILGGRAFHYTHLSRHVGNGEFKGDDLNTRLAMIDACADLLGKSDLRVVAAAFDGDFKAAVAERPDWGARFPSAYSLCFEMVVEQLNRLSRALWDNEPIAVTFAHHREYGQRAQEIWDTFKANGEWENLVTFAYADINQIPALQTGDMIVHETYQCMKRGGIGNEAVWREWPLVRRLLQKDDLMMSWFHDRDSLIKMIDHNDSQGRHYLRRI
jgi:hypothetical protein